jgi:hypothetical protein
MKNPQLAITVVLFNCKISAKFKIIFRKTFICSRNYTVPKFATEIKPPSVMTNAVGISKGHTLF